MVSRRTVVSAEPNGPGWDLALQLLLSGEAPVGLGDLILRTDPGTPNQGRRLHIEFACPSNPALSTAANLERLQALGDHDLEEARGLIKSACEMDSRFAAIVADSGVIYEFVHNHDYGLGTLLVATARRSGPLSWK